MSSLRFVLLGHPVGHSISPRIHQAAYRALGLAHVYEAIDAPDRARFAAELDLVRSGVTAGANVTVPWKLLALELADRAAESAARAGAGNVLVRAEGVLVAHNTDVAALARELGELRPGARRAALIGAGGAAAAAVVACQQLGMTVAVTARRWRAGEPRSAWPGAERFAALGAEPLAWPIAAGGAAILATAWGGAAAAADVVIQATSAGMRGGAPGEPVADVVPWAALGRATAAYDVVYNPRVTPFLEAAARSGLACRDGIGMLVRQAGEALRLWLGVEPPLAVMQKAAEHALRETP